MDSGRDRRHVGEHCLQYVHQLYNFLKPYLTIISIIVPISKRMSEVKEYLLSQRKITISFKQETNCVVKNMTH